MGIGGLPGIAHGTAGTAGQQLDVRVRRRECVFACVCAYARVRVRVRGRVIAHVQLKVNTLGATGSAHRCQTFMVLAWGRECALCVKAHGTLLCA